MLVYDRQMQSETARASIAEGWGGPQHVAGPLLVIPYRQTVTETVTEGGRTVVRSRQVWRELTLSPEDRKSGGSGKRVSVRVDLGGCRIFTKKTTINSTKTN